MKPIIVPTDFSPVSLNAVNYAADLACALNTNLYLIYIFQMPVVYSEIPVAMDNIDDQVKEAEERIKELKKSIAERSAGKIKIHTEVKVDSVIAGIKDLCETVKPYYIVMGTQGAGALERFLLGSNSVSAMKNLSWPLIIVPPGAKFNDIKKIGFACDLKKVAETAPVQEIKNLVKRFGAELHVVHVNAEDGQVYGPAIIEESGLLQEMLDELHPVYHFLNDVNIEDGLSEYAEKNNLDLLIIIPKKHNLIDKLFHKSHSKQLVLHTHVPVMSVHE
jgi:nucleotide-binding universal stress UspA family protein